MALTILEGATFCISDECGDITHETSGFFTQDTRFLSRFRVTVNGETPLLLSSGRIEYFSAAFYLRNPLAGGLPQDCLAIARERFVGETLQERIVVENVSAEQVTFVLGVEVAADFADIFAVKDHDFALGDPLHADSLPEPVLPAVENRGLLFVDGGIVPACTHVLFSRPGEVNGGSIRYSLTLEPRTSWALLVDVVPGAVAQARSERRFGEEGERVRQSLEAWKLSVPQLRSSWDALEHTFAQSVADLASLRMRGRRGMGQLPAAGMPWFMTVFGRDTLIASLQTLLFGPELACGALRTLAALQALEDDPSIDAEPGKIVHEVREGKAATRWFDRYYGTLDATPLYLVLLSEVWRWTNDDALIGELKEPALRALEWIDCFGDRDGDGFVEFERRTERGLVVQSWKDSGDSQRFADGRVAEGPIAPCEVQGYVYDAKLRLAEIARAVWNDQALASRLEREAALLRRRFDEAFWVDDRGGFYALALDGEKRRVDSLCSNVGHLLWSGIVPDERAAALAGALSSGPLWSGWGVRTMSADDAGYNPLAYHNGTVWPHDNSLIALGLERYGFAEQARQIVKAMLDAATYFDHQLPEVFCGLPRAQTRFPIAYPTAARPQAWAAGTPVLLLQVLLGLRPDRERRALVSAAGRLPPWVGSMRLDGVRAFGRPWDVAVRAGEVSVQAA